MVQALLFPSLLSTKPKEDAMSTPQQQPRRILGFNASVGRGWVFSTDQSRSHRPEFLFIDTPSHPNLQMVCSRIIDQHGEDLVAASASNKQPLRIHDVGCEGLQFSFAIRFVCSKKDPKLKRSLEDVYFEGRTMAKHGIMVMVPAMHSVIWGPGRGLPVKKTEQDVDRWIEEVALCDTCPL